MGWFRRWSSDSDVRMEASKKGWRRYESKPAMQEVRTRSRTIERVDHYLGGIRDFPSFYVSSTITNALYRIPATK